MTKKKTEVYLVRASGGRMIHRSDCGYLTRAHNIEAVEWTWARGKSTDEIRAAMPMTGAAACSGCRPLRSEEIR